ncbi:MAG: hypothetical protein LBQ24_04075 [Candidatus Peribacteria bacterium]|jgi:hypothetical protein|nr:hypothetical protein [Candidatus Peribacteria bacterium]
MSVFPHNLNTNQDEIFDINEYPEIIPFLQSMIIEMQKFLKDYMTDE